MKNTSLIIAVFVVTLLTTIPLHAAQVWDLYHFKVKAENVAQVVGAFNRLQDSDVGKNRMASFICRHRSLAGQMARPIQSWLFIRAGPNLNAPVKALRERPNGGRSNGQCPSTRKPSVIPPCKPLQAGEPSQIQTSSGKPSASM